MIRNQEELKRQYLMERFIEQILNEHNYGDVGKAKEYLTSVKRDIREYNKRMETEERLVKDYGLDGFIVLVPLPMEIRSGEKAIKYFEENMRLDCGNSQYDCTGRPFTGWYKVCQRQGRFFVYHRVCFDL